jgi:hypothetical protein
MPLVILVVFLLTAAVGWGKYVSVVAGELQYEDHQHRNASLHVYLYMTRWNPLTSPPNL